MSNFQFQNFKCHSPDLSDMEILITGRTESFSQALARILLTKDCRAGSLFSCAASKSWKQRFATFSAFYAS